MKLIKKDDFLKWYREDPMKQRNLQVIPNKVMFWVFAAVMAAIALKMVQEYNAHNL